jgi:hypothetical protein
MPVCKVCKESKAIRDMRQWGDKPTETCQDCHDAKKAQKKNGDAPGADPVAPTERVAEPAAAPTPPRSPAPTEIIVEASLGFAAKIDGDCIVISQANGNRENDDDNITLTRAEAKRLFESFGEWIVATD